MCLFIIAHLKSLEYTDMTPVVLFKFECWVCHMLHCFTSEVLINASTVTEDKVYFFNVQYDLFAPTSFLFYRCIYDDRITEFSYPNGFPPNTFA